MMTMNVFFTFFIPMNETGTSDLLLIAYSRTFAGETTLLAIIIIESVNFF